MPEVVFFCLGAKILTEYIVLLLAVDSYLY